MQSSADEIHVEREQQHEVPTVATTSAILVDGETSSSSTDDSFRGNGLKYLPKWPPVDIEFQDLTYSVPDMTGNLQKNIHHDNGICACLKWIANAHHAQELSGGVLFGFDLSQLCLLAIQYVAIAKHKTFAAATVRMVQWANITLLQSDHTNEVRTFIGKSSRRCANVLRKKWTVDN